MIQFGSDTIEGDSDRELILYCFQEGLSEVANTNHLPSATVERCQRRGKGMNLETISPRTGTSIGARTQDDVQV